MSEQKPSYMSEEQWQEQQESKRRHQLAVERGVGLVQLSPKRYAIVRPSGTATSNAGGGWYGYVNYDVLDKNLSWNEARAKLREYWPGVGE